MVTRTPEKFTMLYRAKIENIQSKNIVSYFFSASFWYVFFDTRVLIFKWSVSASIRSWEDFRTTASMYFFMGNSFPIDIRVFEHFVHRFECVKVTTSSSTDRVFSEISMLFIEFYRISLIFFDFCWFSLIFIDFTITSRTSFRHLMTLRHPN